MPKGTVVEHKDGTVRIRVPFDAAASDYKFYSNDAGSGDAASMVERSTQSAPAESPPGFHEFDLKDADIGVRPHRGSNIRITKVIAGAESSRFGEPVSFIREQDGGKTIRATTSTANMDGTKGKGLFDFQQKEPVKVARCSGRFSAGTNYTLEIKNAAGAVIGLADSGSAASGFFVQDIRLNSGEHLELKTVTSGNHEAEATLE